MDLCEGGYGGENLGLKKPRAKVQNHCWDPVEEAARVTLANALPDRYIPERAMVFLNLMFSGGKSGKSKHPEYFGTTLAEWSEWLKGGEKCPIDKAYLYRSTPHQRTMLK